MTPFDMLPIDPLTQPGWLLALTWAGGALLVFALHATVLLLAVWLAERLGALKHPGWAEFAWRVALFGAFVSAGAEVLSPPGIATDSRAASAVAAPAAPAPPEAPSAPAAPAPIDSRTITLPAQTLPGAALPMAPAEPAAPTPAAPPAAPSGGDSRLDDAIAVDSGAVDSRAVLPLPVPVLVIGLGLWLAGGMLLLAFTLRQILGLRRLRQRIRRQALAPSAVLDARARRLAAQMAVPVPSLHLLPDLASPMVLGGGLRGGGALVLLPRWAEGLDEAQQAAMLAHEFAHVRRRDTVWRPLQRLALVPLFFHPLAWVAVRRLEALAETLCDRAAVVQGGGDAHSARALAECLAECLARASAPDCLQPPHTRWAVAMAERSDGIVARVRTLLETSPMRLPTLSKPQRWIALGLVLAALVALPGVLVIARDTPSLSITVRENGSTYRSKSFMPTPGDLLHIDVEGAVRFNDAETDIAAIATGARIKIKHTEDAVTRAFEAENVRGRIVRRYSVDGVARPLDADGRAWLARMIPDLYRRTGYQAEARIGRLMARGGVDAVLAEIAEIDNDFVRTEYLRRLARTSPLDDAQYARAVDYAGRTASDFERRHALEALLPAALPHPARHAPLLALGVAIESDFERAEWMNAAARKLPLEGPALTEWMRSLNAFDSSFERKRTIEHLVEHGRPRVRAVAAGLVAARGIDSDFELRNALHAVADSGVDFDAPTYLQAAAGIDSDFERREALLALLRARTPDAALVRGVLQSVRTMGSDFERGEVLGALAEVMPNDAALIEEYRAVARRMSAFERGEAERALDRFYPES